MIEKTEKPPEVKPKTLAEIIQAESEKEKELERLAAEKAEEERKKEVARNEELELR